jgi:hypothetical protein
MDPKPSITAWVIFFLPSRSTIGQLLHTSLELLRSQSQGSDCDPPLTRYNGIVEISQCNLHSPLDLVQERD